MNIKTITQTLGICAISIYTVDAIACTGIKLRADDGSIISARTIDWSGAEMNNIYVIVPRGHEMRSLLPNGTAGGMKFTAKYGFVGLGMQNPDFVVDGTNEAGLNAALFYFPDYGKYRPYSPAQNDIAIADFQLVSWILSQFSTIDQVKSAIDNINVINIDPTASTTHWRITDTSGQTVVLEIIDGVPTFYDNPLGVLANAPGFQWQMTNLNSYVNLYPGAAPTNTFGPIKLKSFSNGTGLLGLPGDFSSPSRFVRASFFQTYSIPQKTGYDAVMQSFHILNNFDVPFGTSYNLGKATFDMPSATQWTISTDQTNRQIYYHTMDNRTIRHIDLKALDFSNIPFQYHPLDTIRAQTIIDAPINR